MPRNLIRDAIYTFTRWRLTRADDPAINALAEQAREAKRRHRRSLEFVNAMRERRHERLRQQFGRRA